MDTFDNLIQILMPHFPKALITPAALNSIRKAASKLAPIYHGGLECRLIEDYNRIDLHQCILRENSEPEILIEHIKSSGWSDHPEWKHVERLCQLWITPSSPLNSNIKEMWLEFDFDKNFSDPPSPSVYR